MKHMGKCLALLLTVLAASATLGEAYAAHVAATPTYQVWSSTFGERGDDWAFSMIQTSDGGYASAGYTNSTGAGGYDAWLIKIGADGKEQWSRTYGGAKADWASGVLQTGDGGYVLAGSTYVSAENEYDFWLIKTDSQGNLLWSKTYGGRHNDYASAVIETSDGGFALAGFKDSFGDGGHSISGFRDVIVLGNADMWLVKTDSEGNQEWNCTYGGAYDDGAFSVVQTADGGYALAGNTYSFSYGRNTDFWLVKTNAEGTQLWNRTFGGAKDDFGYYVIQTQDGGYALTGITNSTGLGYEDVWLIKIDSDGVEEWDKLFGGLRNDEAYFVNQTGDGGYLVAGSTYSYGAGGWDAWLIRTDKYGGQMWSQTYGGVGDDQAFSAIIDSDGNYVLSASTNTFGVAGWDAWIFKASATEPTPTSTQPSSQATKSPVVFGASTGLIAVAAVLVAFIFKKRSR